MSSQSDSVSPMAVLTGAVDRLSGGGEVGVPPSPCASHRSGGDGMGVCYSGGQLLMGSGVKAPPGDCGGNFQCNLNVCVCVWVCVCVCVCVS